MSIQGALCLSRLSQKEFPPAQPPGDVGGPQGGARVSEPFITWLLALLSGRASSGPDGWPQGWREGLGELRLSSGEPRQGLEDSGWKREGPLTHLSVHLSRQLS